MIVGRLCHEFFLQITWPPIRGRWPKYAFPSDLEVPVKLKEVVYWEPEDGDK